MPFALFEVADIDASNFPPASTTWLNAVDSSESDRLKHPSPLRPTGVGLAALVPISPASVASHHPARPLSPVATIPLQNRTSTRALPRGSLPDPPFAICSLRSS